MTHSAGEDTPAGTSEPGEMAAASGAGELAGTGMGYGWRASRRLLRRQCAGAGRLPEVAQSAPAVVGRAGLGILRGRAVGQVAGGAGGAGAGGVALVDQVVAFLAGGRGLAARLPKATARGAAAAGGTASADQQQAQPQQAGCPDHDAGQEQRPKTTPARW